MTDPAIDRATFDALVEMTGGEMDFVDKLVDTYLDDGQGQVTGLLAAVAAGGDPPALVRPAHSLKSGSLNVGALGLGELCRKLVEEARSGTVPDAAQRVAAIEAAFEAVRSALLEERTARAAGE